MNQKNNTIRAIRAAGSLMGWFALVVQLYLILVNRTTDVTETIVRYFSFYTILTNILVAVSFTVSLLSPSSRLGRFFLQKKTITAVAVYITVVGLVYNLILRSLWEPTGMQRLVDELLHTIIPVIFIVYWFLSTPKSPLKWKDAFPWLVYPLVYLLFILFRGNTSAYYPYPFVDVTKLGYSQVFLNCIYLFFCFLAISLVFITIDRLLVKKQVV